MYKTKQLYVPQNSTGKTTARQAKNKPSSKSIDGKEKVMGYMATQNKLPVKKKKYLYRRKTI